MSGRLLLTAQPEFWLSSNTFSLLLLGAALGIVTALAVIYLSGALLIERRQYLNVGLMFTAILVIVGKYLNGFSALSETWQVTLFGWGTAVLAHRFSCYSLALIRTHDPYPCALARYAPYLRYGLILFAGALLVSPSLFLPWLLLTGWLLMLLSLTVCAVSTWRQLFPRFSCAVWLCEWLLISIYLAQTLHWLELNIPTLTWLLLTALLGGVHTCAGFITHYLEEMRLLRQTQDHLAELVTERDAALAAERHANETLESKVQERTFELEVTLRELEEVNHRLEEQSTYDFLSGVRNRKYFDRRYLAESRRSRREQTSLAVIMLDIDYFKQVNDSYGHPAGDDVIRHIARRIQEQLHRPGDEVTRYGGEEFAVILPNTPLHGACQVAKEVINAVHDRPIPTCAGMLSVTASAGVSAAIVANEERDVDLLTLADRALYHAKSQGRDGVAYIDLTTDSIKELL